MVVAQPVARNGAWRGEIWIGINLSSWPIRLKSQKRIARIADNAPGITDGVTATPCSLTMRLRMSRRPAVARSSRSPNAIPLAHGRAVSKGKKITPRRRRLSGGVVGTECQAKVRLVRRRRAAAPIIPKPNSIDSQVAASGTSLVVSVVLPPNWALPKELPVIVSR